MSRATHRLFVLESLPGTISEISVRAGVSRTTAVNWIKSIRADGQAHVSGWKKLSQGGRYLAIYAIGSAMDVPCNFTPMTDKQRRTICNKRAKMDETYQIRCARMAARRRADRAANMPQSWMSALFGVGRVA